MADPLLTFTDRGIYCLRGDSKTEDDGFCEPFQPVPGQAFITECSFGLPVFNWTPQAQVMDQINRWWLCDQGYDAHVAETEFQGESLDAPAPEGAPRRPGKTRISFRCNSDAIPMLFRQRFSRHEPLYRLFIELDQTTRISPKVAALAHHFRTAPDQDGCGPSPCCQGIAQNARQPPRCFPA